jgi:exodeoxyribonuclease V alpha subunit
LVIVDEMSMVDVPLCWRLFRAIDLTCTAVVLVGDHNQLPPVGPGDVLRDLIQTRTIPPVILDKVVRQAGVLKENCTAVLTGQVRPSVKDTTGTPPWLVADRFTEAEAAKAFVISLFEGGTLERLGYDLLRDVQVLTPTHLGPLGTRELNAALQCIIQLRLHGFITPSVPLGRSPRIYLHDKVMQTRNDYKLGVMNGAVGIVVEADGRGNLVVDFDGERVEMDRESGAAGSLQLAYACTIHKAQGSEYPCVICVVHKAHSFQHHRGLLYTAVTRARKTAIVIGDRWGIRNCAQVVRNLERATYLSFLLDPDLAEAR